MNEWDAFPVVAEEPPAPDAGESWDAFPEVAPEAVADTGQSRLASAGNEALKSFAKVGTGTLSALSELPGFFARNLSPVGWAAKAGFEPAKKAVDTYSGALGWMKGAAEGGEASLDENLPTNESYKDEWLASKIPSVVGQAAGQLATALIPAKWAQLGSKAVQTIGLSQAGLLGLDSGYKEAERLGVVDPVKRDILATIFSGTEAGTEALGGLGGKSFAKAITGEIRDLLEGNALKTITKTAVGEGLEEVFAKIPQDIASTGFRENDAEVDTINPTKLDFWSNLGEAWSLGAIAGGVFGGVQATANRKTPTAALGMRAAVQDHEEELLAKQAAGEALSNEEQADLTEMKGYDSRLSAWLESQGLDQASQQAGLVTARAISSATRAGMPATADALREVSSRAAFAQKEAAIRAQLDAQDAAKAQTAPTAPEVAPITPEPVTPVVPVETPVVETAEPIITPPPDASLQPPQVIPPTQESPPQNDATPLPAESLPLQVPATEPQLTPNVLGAVGDEFARRGQEALDRGDEASAESHANAGVVLIESLKRWGAAFPGVKFVDGLRTSMAVNPNDGQLLIDPKYIAEGLADGRYTPKSLDTAMNEEAVHNAVNVATARMMEPELGRAATPQEVNARHAEDWASLPDRVRQESERLYNLTAIERARVESGKKSLTEQEIRDVISQVQAADWQRGAEFKRQVMQGRIWGVITEEAQKNKNFSKWLTDFLNELLVAIKDITKRITDPAALKRLDDLEREVRDVLAKLGVESAAAVLQSNKESSQDQSIATNETPEEAQQSNKISPLSAAEPVYTDQDSAYIAAVEGGDNGSDNLQRLLRETQHGLRPTITKMWMDRNPKSAALLKSAVNKLGRSLGGSEVTHFRHFNKSHGGLLNRSGWDLSRLSESEELNLPELLEFGLEQPREVGSGQKFYFTKEGVKKHKKLVRVLSKASRSGVVEESAFLFGSPSWESADGQVAADPSQVASADAVAYDEEGNIIPPSKRFPSGESTTLRASEPVSDTSDLEDLNAVIAEERETATLREQAAKPKSIDEIISLLDRSAAVSSSAKALANEVTALAGNRLSELKEALGVQGSAFDIANQLISDQKNSRAQKRVEESAPVQEKAVRVEGDEIGERPLTQEEKLERRVGETEEAPEGMRDEDVEERLSASPPVEPAVNNKDRLKQLADWFRRTSSQTQEEGMDPANATKEERERKATGEKVSEYRPPMTKAEIDQNFREMLARSAQESLLPFNKRFGEKVLAYLEDKGDLEGIPRTDMMQVWLGIQLQNNVNGIATRLGIDPRKAESPTQAALSRAGTTLGLAVETLYKPIQRLRKEAQEVTDKAMEKEGIENDQKFAEDINKPVEQTRQDQLADVQKVMTAQFENALSLFDKEHQKILVDIKNDLTRMIELQEELARLEAEDTLSASPPVGAAAKRSKEEVRAELALVTQRLTENLDKYHGTKPRKKKPAAEKVVKEAKAVVAKEVEAKAEATFTEWVSGKEQDGVPKFVDLMSENINAAGFDRDAFMESLLQKFENVDKDLIEDVANRVGDALDAKTEEVSKEADEEDYNARVMRTVGMAVAEDASTEPKESEKNPFVVATKKRLREEITAEQYLEELAKLNVEPQSAFAMNRKVERDIAELKAKAFQRKDAAERKRLQEQYAKKAEADTNRLAKELSDTTPAQKKKVLDDLDKLKADFMNPDVMFSEEMFLERAKTLNIPDEIAIPYVKLLSENRRRTRLEALVKEQQKKEAPKTESEKDRINAEAEREIARLAKEFSDTLPPKTDPKVLTGLKALIEEYKGKNGPPITEEMFRAEAEKLGMDEGQLDRLTSILEESRRRDYLVAITKLDQAAKDKLVKEQKQRDSQAQREIDAIAEKYLSAKTQSAPTEFRKLVNSYKDLEIGEAELRAGLQKLGISPKMIDSLLDSLKVDRAAKVSQNWRKIVDAVAKARADAINRAVNTMKRVSKPKDAPKRSGFVKALTAAAEAGVLDSNAVRDAFSEAYDLHGLTQERMEALADILRRIEAMPEGIPKETLLELAHSALNDIAPSSSVINWLYQNLLGGVLSGASTIVSQFSQLSAVLNPFQATYQFMVKAGGRPMRNPGTFARVWGDYLREAWRTIGVVPVGMQGIAGGQVAGLGVSPSPMASFRPQQQQLSRFGPLETWKFRVGRADWVKALMGTEPKTTAGRFIKGSLLFPSWMASRSFNMIRGAEAWTGSIDRNMEARALLMKSLVDKGMSVQKAYNQVSDKFNPKTNKVMWDEAMAQVEKDPLVAKGLRRQRAEEIMQDRMDAEWNANLKNRHRMMSAYRNFKDDPITTPGLWFAKDVMGKAPTLVKSVFLFSRFFANSLERAIFNSPLGYIHMSKATAAKGAQTELHKRIEAMFGSLENYRQYRNGLATSSVVSTFVMTTALALAWAFWKWGDDDDEGKPPVFWITGATPPSSPYATGRQLAAAGWWQPSSIVINLPGMDKPLLFNYVQGNPELAITLNAIGNVADRVMFPELLNYKNDPRTGEREFSPFKAVVQPFVNAVMSPATRSTYVTTQQAFQRLIEGDAKGVAKLFSRPAGEVAAATVLGGPVVRDVRKAMMPDTPRAAQSWKQALASGVPFADAIGMDTGAPMLNQFGEGVTPFSHIPFITAAQESSDSVKGAAKILNDSGITKEGPQEWMTAPDLYEIALNGSRILLTMDERGEVLGDIGMKFARAVNENERKIRGAKEYDDKKKVVQDLMKDARAQVLRQWRHRVKREE